MNKIKNSTFGFMLVLPSILLMIVVALFPLIYALGISFTKWSVGSAPFSNFNGFKNYATVFADGRFWDSVYTTIIYALMTVPFQLLLGLVIALLLNREMYFQKIFRSAILIPMMITPVIVGVLWKLIFDVKYGILNYFLESIGLEPQLWLAHQSTALWSVAIADIWANTPFIVLLVLAALQSIPHDIYEASSVDGANKWDDLLYITLPHIKTALIIGAIFRLIDSLRTFDYIYIMTQGANGPENIVIYTFMNGFRFFEMGETAAQSYILLILTVICTLPLMKFLFKGMEGGLADAKQKA